MGFCMGGALTLSVSQSGKIDCGVPCYGLPSEGHGQVWFAFAIEHLELPSRTVAP